jgi:hypothetical protein
VTLEDSNLQRNNANLVKQEVVEGMQQAMAVETNTHDAQVYETNQHLHAQLQQMQESMNLLQAQLASQQDQTGVGNQGYFQQACSHQDHGHQGRGYQGHGYQERWSHGRGYQGRGGRDNARPRNTSIYCWTMEAAAIQVLNASTNSMGIKTMPHLKTRKVVTPRIVNDPSGRRMDITLLVLLT